MIDCFIRPKFIHLFHTNCNGKIIALVSRKESLDLGITGKLAVCC